MKNKIKKIHRRYTPKIICNIPRGITSKLVARVSKHNWHYNYDLISLRRQYNMRIHARSELCECLTILSCVLIIHCNYNLYSDYLFEIKAPFEIIAHSMNMLHIYSNGRKSYDPPLNALRILEKLKYLIILRGKNPDTGHNRPLRIWLTKKFFTSRGIKIDELRLILNKYEKWVVKKNLTKNFLNFKDKHLFKMRVIGIDLLSKPLLRNLLIKEKKIILGNKFLDKIKSNIRLSNFKKNNKIINLINSNKKLDNNNNFIKTESNVWYCKFINWSLTQMPYQIILLEKKFKKEKPDLLNSNPEMYYKILLKRGKKLINKIF